MSTKTIAILSAIGLLSLTARAQTPEFFGLHLGDTVTRQQIIDAVGDCGLFNENSDSVKNPDMPNLTYHVFSPARCNSTVYNMLSFITDQNNSIQDIAATFWSGDIYTLSEVDSLFNVTFEDFSARYSNHEHVSHADNNFVDYFEISDGISVCLMKRFGPGPDGTLPIITVAYALKTSNDEDIDTAAAPSLQDTFFGLKLGSKCNGDRIKAAVGYKGNFLKADFGGNERKYIFSDIYFAGNKWKYGEFFLSLDGQLFEFSVYNSLNDGYSFQDERKEAENTYEYLKSKLDEKYGAGNERTEEDGNLSTDYYGGNGVSAFVYNHRSQSEGGQYRRFVGIRYILRDVLLDIGKASDEEF